MDKLFHRGVMRTKCDDCQFVCITQTDYFSILHKGEENTRRHEENGRVVLVTEQRAQTGAASSSQRSHIVIKVHRSHSLGRSLLIRSQSSAHRSIHYSIYLLIKRERERDLFM